MGLVRTLFALTLTGAAAVAAAPQQPATTFRSGTTSVSVDVLVRDGSGAIVRGLTAADFEVREDGRLQSITTFSFEEVAESAAPLTPLSLLSDVAHTVGEPSAPTGSRESTAGAQPNGLTATELAGRRLIALVFDVSSMEPEDVQRAVDAAAGHVEQMTPADLAAVVTIGSAIDVLTDFTGDREAVRAALDVLGYTEGTSTPPAAADTAATDEAAAAGEETTAAADETGFDTFNNDVRLRALRSIAEALAAIEQKKAIVYFSAGMRRNGDDNQVELRGAINAAVRANVSIYAVDTRGLQAVVPGGDARQASGRGASLFSGEAVTRQFSQLSASQDTLVSLSADTGGQAFSDTNDFGAAFARARGDLSAYYLIGYSSSNTVRDGRFRRIQVRVKRPGLRVTARAGYYAERDFEHTSRRDREAQLQDQLAAAVSSTDLPVLASSGWFRLEPDRYYVPIALAVPGSAIPVNAGAETVTIDVLGAVRDERGRVVGRVRETIRVPGGAASTLAGKQILYQSGVTLPPGRFALKLVVRENTSGTVGSFEAPVNVPQLRDAPVKVSSIVLSTQLQPAERGRTVNPLVRDGVQLLPNLTHVVTQGQKAFFYYEVYDPAPAGGAPSLRTSLAFYRGNVKVFETPAVERASIDEPGRNAAVFQFEVALDALPPGLYTSQVNIIDAAAGRVAFPRFSLLVRAP